MDDPRANQYAPVMPYMAVPDAREALGFYAQALGAETVHEVPDDETGGLMHARMIVNGAMVMLHDDYPDADVGAPGRVGGASVSIRLRLSDPAQVDALSAQAVAAGAESVLEPNDAPWGERFARVKDPFGHHWAMGAPLSED